MFQTVPLNRTTWIVIGALVTTLILIEWAFSGDRQSPLEKVARAQLCASDARAAQECRSTGRLLIQALATRSLSDGIVEPATATHLWGKQWLEAPNEFDGCDHVYLDLGTNRGVQVRKLYEPELFPGALVHPVFTAHFPDLRSSVCALGVEPNPLLAMELHETQSYLWSHYGARMRFMTSTGLGITAGPAKVVVNIDNKGSADMAWWGAFVVDAADKRRGFPIKIASASALFSAVASRRLAGPPRVNTSLTLRPAPPPKVIAKVDIEGMECTLFDALIAAKDTSVCAIDILMVECHCGTDCEPLAKRFRAFCPKSNWMLMDDESFGKEGLPLEPEACPYFMPKAR